jgi:hypothetical protein
MEDENARLKDDKARLEDDKARLAHWNNSPRVYMSLHMDILTRFRANKFMLLFLNAVCVVDEQKMPI